MHFLILAAIAASCEVKPPNDSARLEFRFIDRAMAPTVVIDTAKGGPHKVRMSVGDIGGKTPVARDCSVRIGANGNSISFNFFPNPDHFGGTIPGGLLASYLREFGPVFPRTMDFEMRYAPQSDDVELYFAGQFVCRLPESGRVKSVSVDIGAWSYRGETDVDVGDLELEDDRALKFDLKPFAAERSPRYQLLGSRGRQHANAALVKGGAKLSLKPGRQAVEGVPMDVLPVAESLDAGRHTRIGSSRSLFVDPYYNRTSFNVTPAYMQWSVPNGFYAWAWVLCADIGGKGREPSLGMQVTRFSDLGNAGMALSYTNVREAKAKVVGTLTWTEGGRTRTADLKLVRHFLNIGGILDLVNDRPVYGNPRDCDGPRIRRTTRKFDLSGGNLDIDLAGCGAYSGWGGTPVSSVQVFGMTLERAPYGVEFVQSEKGNIFANDEKPETGVELTALADGTKGSFEYVIAADDFRPLVKRTVPFTLAKAGRPELLKLDLDMKTNGWYSLAFTFRNEKDEVLFVHEGAFALLGRDTREAGAESPYSGWAHVRESGRHWNDPDRRRVAELMWKEGIRNSWEPPNDREDEFPEYPIVMSQYQGAKNPPRDKKGAPTCEDPAKMAEYIDGKIEEFAALRKRYPHLRTWLVLHEDGGRDLAEEMLFLPAKKGAYVNRSAPAQYGVRYCTEVCKRVKERFPDVELQVGNGSSSSQRVAWLIRDGFDLDLADKLGIESKGFNMMPELPTQRESAGMAWALWATAGRYGYDKRLSACNEFAFHPERGVTPWNRMAATDNTLRTYLISLLWQFDNICVGHMEDSKSNYWNTNWGAGGHCKAYPYSYPKRMYVALATFTKVFDKAIEPRRIETDGLSTYAWEFTRDRRTRDYASAYWTPLYDAVARVVYPKGTKVTRVSWQGREEPAALADDGSLRLAFGATPAYLVSSAPALRVEAVRHSQGDVDAAKAETLKPITLEGLRPVTGDARLGDLRKVSPATPSANGTQTPVPGAFEFRAARDPAHGEVVEAMLVKGKDYVPEVCAEYQYVKFAEPFEAKEKMRAALWVDGNGSFARMHLEVRDAKGKVFPALIGFWGLVCFDGWHLMPVELQKGWTVTGLWVASTRVALNPKTMVPVEKPVRIGPLVKVPWGVAPPPPDPSERDSMEFVDDKDL